jgi:hypothetical protein
MQGGWLWLAYLPSLVLLRPACYAPFQGATIFSCKLTIVHTISGVKENFPKRKGRCNAFRLQEVFYWTYVPAVKAKGSDGMAGALKEGRIDGA